MRRDACERIEVFKVRLKRMTVKNEKKGDSVRFVSKDERLKAG